MRMLAAFMLFLVAMPAWAQFKNEVDRFTGIHKAVYTSPQSLTKPRVLAAIIRKGTEPPLVRIAFFVFSERSRYKATAWRYLDCHGLNFLVDGKPFDVPPSTHDGDVLSSGVLERVEVTITQEQMAEIGNASSVEFRICGDEFQMSPDDIAGIRQVAEAPAGW